MLLENLYDINLHDYFCRWENNVMKHLKVTNEIALKEGEIHVRSFKEEGIRSKFNAS